MKMEKKYLYSSLPSDWRARSQKVADVLMPGSGQVFDDEPERDNPLFLLSKTMVSDMPFFETMEEVKQSLDRRAKQTGRKPPDMIRIRVTLEVVDEEGKELN